MADLGLRKRRPRGWTEGTAYARRHRTYAPARGVDGEGGETVLDPTDYQLMMDVEWEVHLPDAAPFVVQESARKAPLWVDSSSPLFGKGRRFWSVRVRETHGLLSEVPVPCLLDPRDRNSIWIDWDEGYSRHVPAWDRMSAVERATTLRKGGLDALAERVLSPLRPKLDPADEYLVEEALAAERAEWDAAVAATEAAGRDPALAPYEARHERLTRTGRKAEAVIVSAAPTGRTSYGLPEWAIQLDVTDGIEVRRVVHHEPMGRTRAPWKPGMRTAVRIDPDDPDQLTFA